MSETKDGCYDAVTKGNMPFLPPLMDFAILQTSAPIQYNTDNTIHRGSGSQAGSSVRIN